MSETGAPHPAVPATFSRGRREEQHRLAQYDPGGTTSPPARVADASPEAGVDRIADEGDVPVAEEGVDPAGVQAPRRLPAGVVIRHAVVLGGVRRRVVVVQRVEVVAVPPPGPLVEHPAALGRGAGRFGQGAGQDPREGRDPVPGARESARSGCTARRSRGALGGRHRRARPVDQVGHRDRLAEDERAVGPGRVAPARAVAGAEGVVRRPRVGQGGRGAVARAEEDGDPGRHARRVLAEERPEGGEVARSAWRRSGSRS